MTLYKKENSPSRPRVAPGAKRQLPQLKQTTIINGVVGQPTLISGAISQPTLFSGAISYLHKLQGQHAKDGKKEPPKLATNGNKAVPTPTQRQDVKAYHWQSEGAKKSSVDDMVLLSKISEAAITENLKKRFMEDKIYTYIGPVLVAVNPFKHLGYFGEQEVSMYQGAAPYELPPHIYAIADSMFRNMVIDSDSQCVIISGESGAGKTVSAKFIMNYITQVAGGGGSAPVQTLKEIIMDSNPLLEAFGNAKTIRNNNSSRFGKYIEIVFSPTGEPRGGRISNFLLEKSRVHFLNERERNFHIFYQLCSTSHTELRQELGLTSPEYYTYLRQSGVYKVEGINDGQDFLETLRAMEVMGIAEETRVDILRVVAAILHMGNICFVEEGNRAHVADPQDLDFPAYLLGISREDLSSKLTTRVFDSKWGSVSERLELTLNGEQAPFARDAWAKGLYARLFDHIVKTINVAMETACDGTNIGILDIYGFEIFNRNGFEQFCINYVNEKLQQIFIELTLKLEQEEYKEEGIQWTPVQFFNNKVVCDLIESRRPPGIFSVLDDTVATMNAVSEGADEDFRNKMTTQVGTSPHYHKFKDGFTIKHYAGTVDYHIEGFCEKNRDVLFVDIIEVMQRSSNPFVRSLFSEDDVSSTVKGRPTTAATKIRAQANLLMTTLSACVPSYIRCIKPNETQRPKDWQDNMVKDQVEYLGLKENIKVKRAGFAYRRPFEKFIRRYSILAPENDDQLLSHPQQGVHRIMRIVNMDDSHYQLGITKCFIKDPESLYMLEECRERKYDHYARIVQKAFRKAYSQHRLKREREEANATLQDRKQRRAQSINRRFFGDYVGVDLKASLSSLIPRKEKVLFAETVSKYDRRFRTCKRDLILTPLHLFLIGLTRVPSGPRKGQMMEAIKRKIRLQDIQAVSLSTLADNFVLFHVKNDVESLLEVNFKTEFLMLLNRSLVQLYHSELTKNFVTSFQYNVKKLGRFGQAGTRRVEFVEEGPAGGQAKLCPGSTLLQVNIGAHLPAGTHHYQRPIQTGTPTQHLSSRFNNNNNNIYPGPFKKNPFNPSQSRGTATNRSPPPPGASSYSLSHNRAGEQPRGLASRIRPPQTLGTSAVIHPWPPNAPPPPSQPAPADQPAVNRRPAAPPPPPKPKLNQVKALYSYDARDTDELSFVEGEVFELTTEDDSGWWVCRIRGREGFCPGNYLEKI